MSKVVRGSSQSLRESEGESEGPVRVFKSQKVQSHLTGGRRPCHSLKGSDIPVRVLENKRFQSRLKGSKGPSQGS